MKFSINSFQDVVMVDSEGLIVQSFEGVEILRQEKIKSTKPVGETVKIGETIINYLKEAYGLDLEWIDVVKQTQGESIFIIPLYKEAEAYFNTKNEVKEKRTT